MARKTASKTRRSSRRRSAKLVKPVPYIFAIGPNELKTAEAREAKKMYEYRRVTLDAGQNFTAPVRVIQRERGGEFLVQFMNETKSTREWRITGASKIRSSFGGEPDGLIDPNQPIELEYHPDSLVNVYVRDRNNKVSSLTGKWTTIDLRGDEEFKSLIHDYVQEKYLAKQNAVCDAVGDSCSFTTDPQRLFQTLLAICAEVDSL